MPPPGSLRFHKQVTHMKTFETIMVPLAFSSFSRELARYAAGLADLTGSARLLFVNVINERDVEAVERISSFGYDVDGNEYVNSLEQERVAALEKMLAQIDLPRERMKLIITVGRPADSLLKIALREQVDLIVMGVKAKGEFFSHALTGSVAEKLFRRSPVPILSYRSKKIAEELRKHIRS